MRKIFSAGNIALFLSLLVISLWTFWGVIEMFHEGWYTPFEWLFFLLPAVISILLTLIAITWQRFGGWLLIVLGAGFFAWMTWQSASRYGLNLWMMLRNFPMDGLLVLIGVLFLLDARRQKQTVQEPDPRWWRRNLKYILVLGVPLLLGVGLAIEPAVRVATRVDDGNYGARLIEGNDVTLLWAPEGPGWQVSVSWNQVALYGLHPIGFVGKSHGVEGKCNKDISEGCASKADMQRYNVCLYLSEDGSHLEETVQNFWRMPSADELVRSLVRHGENARCTWNHQRGRQPCEITPDKETPLWNPHSPIIYLLSADEASPQEAYFVTYNGAVYTRMKFVGMGSQGYRCVRDDLP
jgi:hypothetical protein